jgi:hypothetical protein
MTLRRLSQNLNVVAALRYISMSAIVIGYIAFNIPNMPLARASGTSLFPTCSTVSGTVTGIKGKSLQISSEQGGKIINAQYSNATDIVKEDVVTSSDLRKGIDVQVLITKAAQLVMLDPSDQPNGASALECQMPQSAQNSTPTAPGGSQIMVSQGTIQQITDNTFTILPRSGLPKTFAWTTNTAFVRYTDHQSPQILSSGASVLLVGPMSNGVIMASRITVLPNARQMGLMMSCKLPVLSCPPIPDFIALAILALVFV